MQYVIRKSFIMMYLQMIQLNNSTLSPPFMQFAYFILLLKNQNNHYGSVVVKCKKNLHFEV